MVSSALKPPLILSPLVDVGPVFWKQVQHDSACRMIVQSSNGEQRWVVGDHVVESVIHDRFQKFPSCESILSLIF